MKAPATFAAILLAYDLGTDKEVTSLLQDVFVSGDTPSLDFLQTAAFQLQQAGYMVYMSYGQQRLLTLKGKAAARDIRMEMLKQDGEMSDMALIRTLTQPCINELIAWHASNAVAASSVAAHIGA